MNEDSRSKPRPIVGWREWVALPQLGITTVKAKVDTGAKTSALHTVDLEVLRRADGDVVRFRVHTREGDDTLGDPIEYPLLEEREIRSSNGQRELRPLIQTQLVVGEQIWHAEVTLTTREQMGFNMLLGRSALKQRFWVDPSRSFLQGTNTPSSSSPTSSP